MTFQRICVYCGSRDGKKPIYKQAAYALGQELARRKIELVYGGASIGVMAAVANAVLEFGGKVTGVLPKMLTHKEIAHSHVTELIIVESMHQRKQIMYELSDAFVALPGGLGTFEELCEILTWQQLGTHQKPTGILNIDGYYDPLLKMFDKARDEDFVSQEHRNMIVEADSAETLFQKFENYIPPDLPFWVKETQT